MTNLPLSRDITRITLGVLFIGVMIAASFLDHAALPPGPDLGHHDRRDDMADHAAVAGMAGG